MLTAIECQRNSALKAKGQCFKSIKGSTRFWLLEFLVSLSLVVTG